MFTKTYGHHQLMINYPWKSLTNGRGSWVQVVGVGVGEELIMIINMNIINISYI